MACDHVHQQSLVLIVLYICVVIRKLIFIHKVALSLIHLWPFKLGRFIMFVKHFDPLACLIKSCSLAPITYQNIVYTGE